jgi:hypothetical protein
MQDLIGYDEIIENSMRGVIFEALKKIEKSGLLGKHYFIITFLTRFPGATVPKTLSEKYPEEMTIAIQHQYKALSVTEDGFKISLSFGGKFEKLAVPFKAITSFADPSMNFALKFSIGYGDIESLIDSDFGESNKANKSKTEENKPKEVDLSAKVISLEAFRRNKTNNPDNNS